MPTLPWKAPNSPPPADGPVTVMASRLELRRLSDVPSFLAAALRIRRQMLASPGVLGLSLIARPLRRTFWTLSAWQDQAAMSAAVICAVTLVAETKLVGRGLPFQVTWAVLSKPVPLTVSV